LSPSTRRMDKLIKFQKYQKAGVRELWMVDPDTDSVEVYILENGKYISTAYADTDNIKVSVLDGCEIVLGDVFAE